MSRTIGCLLCGFSWAVATMVLCLIYIEQASVLALLSFLAFVALWPRCLGKRWSEWASKRRFVLAGGAIALSSLIPLQLCQLETTVAILFSVALGALMVLVSFYVLGFKEGKKR